MDICRNLRGIAAEQYAAAALVAWLWALGVSGLVLVGVLPAVALLIWLGLPAMGLVISLLERRPAAAAPAPSRLARDRARRLVEELSRARSSSVDELSRRTGWSTDAVLEGLAHAVSSGQVEEDIDVDRGEYVYSVTEEVVLGLEPQGASLESVQERLAHRAHR